MDYVAAVLLGLTAGILIGYRIEAMREKVATLSAQIQQKRTPVTPPKSSIFEPPLTPEEQVVRDQEELLARLNPRA